MREATRLRASVPHLLGLGALAFLLLGFLSQIDAGELDAVVKCYGPGGFCSGVIVAEDGLLLTAKHCGAADAIEVEIAGREGRIKAVKVAEDNLPEGAVAYDLDGEGYAFLRVAQQSPSVGDKVRSIGFPGQKLASGSGTITGHSLASASWQDGTFFQNLTDLQAAPGWSGGPLLNEAGEVIGLCSNGDENATGFVSYGSICRVYAAASEVLVYAFVLRPGLCPPCDRLKSDVKNGYFPGYRFEFVTYDERTGIFDKPEVYAAFQAETGVNREVHTPLVWVPGSGKFREKYETQSAVYNFLEGAVSFLVNGRRPRLPVEAGGPAQPLEPIPSAESLAEQIRAVKEEAKTEAEIAKAEAIAFIEKVKADTAKAIEDAKIAMNGNILQKVAIINDLRNDLKNARQNVATVKSEIEAAKADPLSVFAIFGGLFTGFLEKRLRA